MKTVAYLRVSTPARTCRASASPSSSMPAGTASRSTSSSKPRPDRRHARHPDQGRHRLHRHRGQLPLASSGLRSKPSNTSLCDWMTASTLSDAARSLKPHASCRHWRPAASAVTKTTPSVGLVRRRRGRVGSGLRIGFQVRQDDVHNVTVQRVQVRLAHRLPCLVQGCVSSAVHVVSFARSANVQWVPSYSWKRHSPPPTRYDSSPGPAGF